MTDQEVSKIITEKMGKCYHEHDTLGFCKHCGVLHAGRTIDATGRVYYDNPDWTSREKRIELLEWLFTQEWVDWFSDALKKQGKEIIIKRWADSGATNYVRVDILPRLARLVAEWWEEE